MKYIDAEKLIAEIESRMEDCKLPDGRFPTDTSIVRYEELSCLRNFITSLQQEQPKGNLEYWLEHFGMPKENIDNCITQIAQGYGACRYLYRPDGRPREGADPFRGQPEEQLPGIPRSRARHRHFPPGGDDCGRVRDFVPAPRPPRKRNSRL